MDKHQHLKGIEWVLPEVEASVTLAVDALEAWAAGGDGEALDLAKSHMLQLRGCLKIVGCQGGVLLCEELLQLLDELSEQQFSNEKEVIAVLVQATSTIPHYMRFTLSAGMESTETLLSTLNELRAVRGQPFYSEAMLFSPDLSLLDSCKGEPVAGDNDSFRALTKNLRKIYQTALLGVIKGHSLSTNLKYLEKVSARLRELCLGTRREFLWQAAGAVIEALFHHAIPLGPAVKSLLRSLDREIYPLAEEGVTALKRPFPTSLFSNLLYYVALSQSETPRVVAVRKAFNLSGVNYVVSESLDPEASRGLSDAGIMAAVGSGLEEELDHLKALIESYLSGSTRDLALLKPLLPGFKRVVDTLALVGDGPLRKIGQSLLEMAEKSLSGTEITLPDIERIAGKMLELQSSLTGWQLASQRNRGDKHASPVQQMEVNRAWHNLLIEAMTGVEALKAALVRYVTSDGDHHMLRSAAAEVDGLAGALDMVSLHRAASLLRLCKDSINIDLLGISDQNTGHNQVGWKYLDELADILTATQDYLERVQEGADENSVALLDSVAADAERLQASLTCLLQQQSDLLSVNDNNQQEAPASKEADTMDEQDIDPEIREIFVEEAREVLGAIDEALPQWLQSLEDLAALKEVRRSFHTLKGSGRMAGATVLGELAWSVENLLNKVLDGKLDATPETARYLKGVVTVLPGLVNDYEHSQQTIDQGAVDNLQQVANAMANGESCSLDELDKWIGGQPAEDSATPALSEDQQLLVIFASEAKSHFDFIVDLVKNQRSKAPFYESPSPQLHSALHTLKGGANIANLPPLVALITPLERFIREVVNFQVVLDEDMLDLLDDGVAYSQRIIEQLSAGNSGEIEESKEFLSRLKELNGRVTAVLQDGDGNKRAAVDPSFLNQLMGEGMQHVVTADEMLAAWDDQTSSESIHLVISELGELESGAGNAGFPPMAALAKAMQSAYQVLLSQQSQPAQKQKDCLISAHETLLGMIDAVAAHQVVPEAEQSLLADLAGIAGLSEKTVPKVVAHVDAADSVLPAGADIEVVELFLGEVDELLETVEHALANWRENPSDNEHPDLLKRALHTYKGGALMAGLQALGASSHDLESLVISREAEVAAGDVSSIKDMLAGYDHLHAGTEAVKKAIAMGGKVLQPEAAAPAAEKAEHRVSGPGKSAEILPFTGKFKGLEAAKASSDSADQQSAEMVRVTTGALEALVNLAGETSISRSQVEQHINEFMFSLEEMQATIQRMQDQVRRLGIETDAQVMFRREQIESSDTTEGFDPLEMDRYSSLQQLSQSLLESASDLQDLRTTLVDKSRDAEALLLQQSRIHTELQENLMRTRMVPFSRVVPRLRRIVRQVSGGLGKDVVLKLEGTEGELDRTLLERIVPSLEHLIRNAIDHGVEDRNDRIAAGKALEGTLSLNFAREGGDVVIRLADDGRGLDIKSIKAKAIEKGLLAEGDNVSDAEITQCIFMPGFSTASNVTEVSGRGVGMDVVNTEVRQLGGSIHLETRPGAGTEFVLRLPFTVSVNRALMIEAGGDSYGLALKSVSGITRISVEELQDHYQNPEKTLEYAGEHYEIRYLGSLLSEDIYPVLDTALGQQVPLVLIRTDEKNYAVHVDGLIGSQEVVVKTLGYQFSRVPGLSGATVLGDGRVVVILDLQSLLRSQGAFKALSPVKTAPPKQEDHVPTVMVVDDSVTVRKVTGRLLEREGLRAITAKDGVDAMRLLQDITPDIMLLDIEMPRMDGFEVLRLVRTTQRLKDLPIIMITSRTGEKHREKAFSMGVNQYLGKPYQEDLLLKEIYNYLPQQGAAKSVS